MHRQFVGCAAGNILKGRPSDFTPDAIVLHGGEGSLESLTALFAEPASQTSVHYAVGRDGRVLQFVDEQDCAFHAGIILDATWALMKGGKNPNLYTIGITWEGEPGDQYTSEQYHAGAELIADIATRWNIPIDNEHIVLHSEIRASRQCPGPAFDRVEVLSRATALHGHVRSITDAPHAIEVLKDANVREAAPSTTARIVRVVRANTKLDVAGFTHAGERVQGNPCWYRTSMDEYIWAGSTSVPQPRHTIEAPPPLPVPPAATSPITTKGLSGIALIDALRTTPDCPSIGQTATDRDAVAVIQDLLTGHKCGSLPGLLDSDRGLFGTRTINAVRVFQKRETLSESGEVDAKTFSRMVEVPSVDPRATQAHLTLVLGLTFGALERVLSLVAQMEGVGRFAAINDNRDRAGLSFGIIQWAQKPGRLPDILKAFRSNDAEKFVQIFGNGDATLVDLLLKHITRRDSGIDPKTGRTLDSRFDLITNPWIGRFTEAAMLPAWQEVQVTVALAAFRKSLGIIEEYAVEISSERGIAFMLDMANQFGDAGARNVYKAVRRDAMSERSLLCAIADESVARMVPDQRRGVRARRDKFLQTSVLSDAPFGLR